MAAFARRAIALSLADRVAAAAGSGWVFFDRGLIDAAVALQHATGEPAIAALGYARRYNSRVFLTPPWPEIYRSDHERRHSLVDAVAEYDRLCRAYTLLGYKIADLPRISVAERADFGLAALHAE